MKKIFLLVLYSTAISITYAQHTKFNLYSGYTFDDRVDSYYDTYNYYNGKIQGGFVWGAGIEFMTQKYYGIELMYNRMDSHAPMTYYNNGLKNKTFDIGLNQIMVACNRYFPTNNPKVEPYFGAMMGLTIFSLKNPDPGGSSSITKLGYGIRFGTNIFATDKVGIKLQAQLMSAAQAVGGGFYFGTGGSGAGVTSYSSFYQFGLVGGLTFKMGK